MTFIKGQRPPKKGQKLTGSPKGYEELAQRTREARTATPDFTQDPAIQAAMAADAEMEKDLEAKAGASIADAEASLVELVEQSAPIGGHDFANGASIPFPYQGYPTTNHATCSRPVKEENRGCPVWAHCPMRDTGPWLYAYMDKRNKNQVRHINCVDFLKTGMVFQPHLVLLPGVTWEGTIVATYPLRADGSEVEPGPGRPKPPLKLTATKSLLPPELFPSAELMLEFQRLRRHGEIRPFRL